jgi:hypothetical protein
MLRVYRVRCAVPFAGLSVLIALAGGCAPQQIATSTTPLVPAATSSSGKVATPPSTFHAPVAATKLTFSFAPSEAGPFGAHASGELLRELSHAGFRFSHSGETRADARFEVRIADDEASARKKVWLVLADGDAVIEWATSVVEAESMDERVVRDLVARMCRSSRLETFAEEAVESSKERSAAPRREPPALAGRVLEPPPSATPNLGPAALRRCRNARERAPCEPVLDYLRKHPNGVRAAEAMAAWKLAEPRIERMTGGTTK